MTNLALRDLIAVVTLGAVLVAWWVDHRRLTGRKILPVPKVALRDIFSFVTIAALALGWWLDHRRLEQENQNFRTELIYSKVQALDLKDALNVEGHEVEFGEAGRVTIRRDQRK